MEKLFEGIDIYIDSHKKGKYVVFTDEHEYGVNTSLDFNPRRYDKKVGSYTLTCISIFLRKEYFKFGNKDGNPLIYALKGLYGWRIDKKNKEDLMKRFHDIVAKMDKEVKYDTIVIIPSSNELNNIVARGVIKNIGYKVHLIKGFFSKISIDDFDEVECFDYEKMYEVLGDKEANQMCSMFFRSLKTMRSGIFQMKLVPTEARKIFDFINFGKLSLIDDNVKYKHVHKMINDKNILLIDDTISTGETLSIYSRSMLKSFAPKSITVLTLLSARGIK
jgi:hypothetical protein